jgi:hypothetical protein
MTIAFWCVLAAVLLPYICFGIARNRGRGVRGERLRDNRNPRDFPNRIEGSAKRAWMLTSTPLNRCLDLLRPSSSRIWRARRKIKSTSWRWFGCWPVSPMWLSISPTRARCAVRPQFLSLACVLALFVVAGLG